MVNAIKKMLKKFGEKLKEVKEKWKALPEVSRHDIRNLGIISAALLIFSLILSIWWLDWWSYKPLLQWLRRYFPYTNIPHQYVHQS